MAKRKKHGAPRVAISSSQRAMRVPRKAIGELVAFVADAEGYPVADADIAVMDRAEIAELNRRYLRHAGATDVLSFDLSEAPTLGLSVQIIVCGDVAVAEAAARNIPARNELLLYVIHGLLHVMGYEDKSIRGAARMRARQEELLAEYLSRARGKRGASR